MSITIDSFNENMQIIGDLPIHPTLTGNDLQSEFDKGGKLIKEYLNGTLIPELNTNLTTIDNNATTGKTQSTTNKASIATLNTTIYGEDGTGKTEGLNFDINGDGTTTNPGLKSKVSTLESTINSMIGMGNFAIESISVNLSTNTQYGWSTGSASPTLSGYNFLGTIGWRISAVSDNNTWNIREVYASNWGAANPTIYVQGNAEPAKGNISYTCTVQVFTLWVKI